MCIRDRNKDVVKMESVVVLHDVEFDEDIEYTIAVSYTHLMQNVFSSRGFL